jgi:hypothetical protein
MSSELAPEGVLSAFTTMSDAWALMDATQFACVTDDSGRSPRSENGRTVASLQ